MDEAHATLVCGDRGAGAAEALGISDQVSPVHAFGSQLDRLYLVWANCDMKGALWCFCLHLSYTVSLLQLFLSVLSR